MSYKKTRKLFLVILGVLLALMYFVMSNISFIKVTPDVKKVSSAFDNLSLEAKGAYAFDVTENRVLYAKNEDVTRPLASLTKIMTAICALETLPANTPVTTTVALIQNVGDINLKNNTKWALNDLVSYMLVTSSNDAAETLAITYGRDDFIRYMNAKARTLGFVRTSFGNPSGLDDGKNPTSFGSPEEVATLLWYGYTHYEKVFGRTGFTSYNIRGEDGAMIHALNTDTAFDRLPSVLASKTGFTDAAGGNLAIITDVGLGHPVVIVVMGSSVEGRFDDAVKIVDAIMKDNLNQK